MPKKNGNSSKSNRRVDSRITQLQKSINGSKYTPSSDPKGFCPSPWYPIILQATFAVATSTAQVIYTMSNIRALLQAQLPAVTTGNFTVKIKRISVWSSPLSGLGVRFNDPSTGETQYRYSDECNLNGRSRAGYAYPDRISTVPFSSGTTEVVNIDLNTPGAAPITSNGIIRFNMEFYLGTL